MNHKIRIAALLMALIMTFSACGIGNKPKEETTEETAAETMQNTETSEEPESTREAVTIEETEENYDESVPLDFTWNPYAYGDFYEEHYSEEVHELYNAFVEAVLNGETEIECKEGRVFGSLYDIMYAMFPLSNPLLSDYEWRDGVIYLTYRVSDEERVRIIEDFGNQVEWIITSCVKEGDTDVMAALALYIFYSSRIVYDYTALDDDVDVSPYRGLMDFSGICQSFAYAYAYLCRQCGVDVVPAGGLTEELDAHVWVMLNIDGKYYYADPTFECGVMYGENCGLRYFGMTGERREMDGYPADEVNVGEINIVWGRDIDVSDERFSEMWDIQSVIDVSRKDGKLHLICDDGTGTDVVLDVS